MVCGILSLSQKTPRLQEAVLSHNSKLCLTRSWACRRLSLAAMLSSQRSGKNQPWKQRDHSMGTNLSSSLELSLHAVGVPKAYNPFKRQAASAQEASAEIRGELGDERVLPKQAARVFGAHHAEQSCCDGRTDELVDNVDEAPEHPERDRAGNVDAERQCRAEGAAGDVPRAVASRNDDDADGEAVELLIAVQAAAPV